MLVGPINSGAAVGGNGVATAVGYSTQRIRGLVYAVQVVYNDSPPAATTDVTIATKGTNPTAITILTLTDGATNALKLPRLDTHTTAGVAQTQNNQMIYIDDIVSVTIAQANAADNVDVWLYMVD